MGPFVQISEAPVDAAKILYQEIALEADKLERGIRLA